jgi:predicted PurR-regulated permease PerM
LVLLIAGVAWLVMISGPLVGAIIVAALIAYLLNPVVVWLARRTPLGQGAAAELVFLLSLLLVIAIPASLGTVAVSQFSRFRSDLVAAAEELEALLVQPISLMGFRLVPEEYVAQLLAQSGELLRALPGGSLNVLSSLTSNILWALVVVVLVYYFLKDGARLLPWLVRQVPGPYQPEAERLLEEVNAVWGKFLRIQILMFGLLSLMMLAGTGIIVALFRTGLLRWSPYLFVLLLIGVYTLIQQIDNLWLRPQLLGRSLHLHPGVVFVGLVGALIVSGFLGALLVVPLLGTAKVTGRYLHRKLLGKPGWADAEQTDREAQERAPEEEPVQAATS